MRIVLSRHGESDSVHLGKEDLCPQDNANALTARGIGQVERLASEVAGLLVAPRVFASDMQRAFESGQIIARQLNTSVETWPELREMGDSRRHHYRRRKARLPEVLEQLLLRR
jgi:broad specificity phosphatase PhoE